MQYVKMSTTVQEARNHDKPKPSKRDKVSRSGGILVVLPGQSCSTYKNRSRTACTMHSIKHEWLEAAVLFAVQHQEHLAVSYSEIVTQINSAPTPKASLTDWTI